jgi:hypothetical protein
LRAWATSTLSKIAETVGGSCKNATPVDSFGDHEMGVIMVRPNWGCTAPVATLRYKSSHRAILPWPWHWAGIGLALAARWIHSLSRGDEAELSARNGRLPLF